MGITLRHDAAAVMPPSNASTRKYGQSLVLQQQQQKYAGHQAGLNRLFDATTQQNQNLFQLDRDQQQKNFQWDMGQARNQFQQGRDKAQQDIADRDQRKKDFDAARSRIDTHAKDMLANGEIKDLATRQKIQNLLAGKTIVMGSDWDETERQNYLDQYNEQLAKILSEVPAPKPEAPPQPNFHTDQNGKQWVESGPGKWEPVPQESQPRQPKTAQEYYNDPKNEAQLQKDLDAKMKTAQDEVLAGTRTKALTPEEAWGELQKEYESRQKMLGRGPSSSLPVPPPPPAGTVDPVTGQQQQAGAFETLPNPAGPPPVPEVLPQQPQQPPPWNPEAFGIEVPPKVQWEDDAFRIVEPPAAQAPGNVAEVPAAQPVASPPAPQQQIKVGGKPLAVTPGTLTPQETAARGQIMELPQEERIKALMPYDQELKGKTLEQILNDPESKKQYDEMTKQGLTTGNYREDMLEQLDTMLQHNILNSAGQSPPGAYVGMRADEIADPKAKAEVGKLPRPKSKNDREAIRSGQLYVDPEGVIRARA